ncbi:cytochrome-c peroxidase [Undibacterium sp. Jales W-56]|uniref:cytochrome-c peroxidase n=1 Tax=Undibacterium sp. Jales W-56 TaxID=2897325 RepID=UPI0021D2ECA4|nr:cytochrome c peroxidase [Undibacterium sp. Jales W-56]MCU6434385.1 cytochrome-c peroxidase [Undibacterium sp. Jales W-56]
MQFNSSKFATGRQDIAQQTALSAVHPSSHFFIKTSLFSIVVGTVLSLSACGGGSAGNPSSSAPAAGAGMSAPATMGEKIFKDVSLSASGKQSCATCHNPDNAHAQSNDLSVQLGGPNMDVPGFRAVPSLRYLNLTPAFSFGADGKPSGGFDRDGRAASLSAQAERPFLAPHEMANASKADVVAKLQRAAYASEFKQAFGAGIFDNADLAFDRIQFALQQYQKEDEEFHPYDSKYDQFLAGRVKLDAAELRGLALFNNPTKGNCAACHISSKGSNGASPLFTDFSYDNIGVPRNYAIPASADASYFDLGLCGPDRSDLTERSNLCGAFKVPTLRNVATRKVFFHNGRFKNLRDALGFYVRRDTNPEEWYPTAADGSVLKFDDLPAAYVGNVNITEVPYNRKRGMPAALTSAEIDDVVKFLGTLNDGYKP